MTTRIKIISPIPSAGLWDKVTNKEFNAEVEIFKGKVVCYWIVFHGKKVRIWPYECELIYPKKGSLK